MFLITFGVLRTISTMDISIFFIFTYFVSVVRADLCVYEQFLLIYLDKSGTDFIINTTNVTSRGDCILSCHQQDTCVSMEYAEYTGRCVLHGQFPEVLTLTDQPDTNIYYRQGAVPTSDSAMTTSQLSTLTPAISMASSAPPTSQPISSTSPSTTTMPSSGSPTSQPISTTSPTTTAVSPSASPTSQPFSTTSPPTTTMVSSLPPSSQPTSSTSPPTTTVPSSPSPASQPISSTSPPTTTVPSSPSPTSQPISSTSPPTTIMTSSPPPTSQPISSTSPPTTTMTSSPSPASQPISSASPPTTTVPSSPSPASQPISTTSPTTTTMISSASPTSQPISSTSPPTTTVSSSPPPTSQPISSASPPTTTVPSSPSPTSQPISLTSPPHQQTSTLPPSTSQSQLPTSPPPSSTTSSLSPTQPSTSSPPPSTSSTPSLTSSSTSPPPPPTTTPDENIRLWASGVDMVSSEKKNGQDNAAIQVLGPPDVYPSYGHNPLAWAQYQSRNEFIELRYEMSLYILEVHVYETYRGGAIWGVDVKRPTGGWHFIYQTNQLQKLTYSRIFSVPINPPPFATNVLTLLIDTMYARGSVEIDAVEVVGTTNPQQ